MARSPFKTPGPSSPPRSPLTKVPSMLNGGAGPFAVKASKSRPSSPAKAGGMGRMDIVAEDFAGLSIAQREGSKTPGRSKSPSKKSAKQLDRYIPSRSTTASSSSSNSGQDNTGPIPFLANSSAETSSSTLDPTHVQDLTASLGVQSNQRILSFFAPPPAPSNEHHSTLLSSYSRLAPKGSAASGSSSNAAASRRRIATSAERVLDAPGLMDDYYLNLLDWSSSNLVAIGLAESVYVWNAESGEVSHLCSVADDDEDTSEYVASVKWAEDGAFLAVGLSSGPIQIYDVQSSTRVRTMAGHSSRVPSLSWSNAILSSGSRTGEIWNSDVRVATHKVGEMRGHRGEVCGLAWRPEAAGGLSGGGQGLLASGGNDNVVNVWDGRMLSAAKMCKTNHTAAVKALAWSPWQQSLLATGGGSSDRTIHFWNTTTSARISSQQTPSQVTSIIFNPHDRELLSTHGVPDNHISVWRFPSLTKQVDIPDAHEARILHSALSPDGTTVATAASDENLKFWKVFEGPKGKKAGAGGAGALAKDESSIPVKGKTGLSVR